MDQDPSIQAPAPVLTGRAIRDAKRAEVKAKRLKGLENARKADEEKRARRNMVLEKVRQGIPITDEEREWMNYRAKARLKKEDAFKNERELLDKASRLLIKPSTVQELRRLVETMADRHGYNPLEQLIMMTIPTEELDPITGAKVLRYPVNAEKRAEIHKALLPYLTPQLKVAPVKEAEPEAQGVKVTIKRFELPSNPTGHIYNVPKVTALDPKKE